MHMYKSQLTYDKDLLDMLLKIRIDSGYVSYEEVWTNRNIVLQLMDEVQKFRNAERQVSE